MNLYVQRQNENPIFAYNNVKFLLIFTVSLLILTYLANVT